MLNSFYDRFIYANGLQYRNNNFFLANLPFVMLPIDALATIAQKEDRNLNLALYSAVKEAIMQDVKRSFQVDFGIEGEKGLEFMETYLMASGWGQLERTDLDFPNARCLVSVTSSPVANYCTGVKMPVDTILRGFLAGIFSIYFNKGVECIEVKCAALGESQCNFVIKPLEDFDFGNPLTRHQLRVE